MRFVSLLFVVAALLMASAARADGGSVAIEARGAWTILGTKNPTGGFTPSVTGVFSLPLGRGAQIGLGADLATFGLGRGSRWIGVLGGPVLRFTIGAGSPVAASVSIAADFGRVPVCTPWAMPLCPRFVGFFPAGNISLVYAADGGFVIGGSFSARVVQTLIGTTASFEPAVVIGMLLGGR